MLFIHLADLAINITILSVVHILQQSIFLLIAYFVFRVFDTAKDKLDTRRKKDICFLFLGSSTLRSEARQRLNKGQQWSQRKVSSFIITAAV